MQFADARVRMTCPFLVCYAEYMLARGSKRQPFNSADRCRFVLPSRLLGPTRVIYVLLLLLL